MRPGRGASRLRARSPGAAATVGQPAWTRDTSDGQQTTVGRWVARGRDHTVVGATDRWPPGRAHDAVLLLLLAGEDDEVAGPATMLDHDVGIDVDSGRRALEVGA